MVVYSGIEHGGVGLVFRQETSRRTSYEIRLITGRPSRIDRYYRRPGQAALTGVVTRGSYFMLGDNPDDSADSRYWGVFRRWTWSGKPLWPV